MFPSYRDPYRDPYYSSPPIQRRLSYAILSAFRSRRDTGPSVIALIVTAVLAAGFTTGAVGAGVIVHEHRQMLVANGIVVITDDQPDDEVDLRFAVGDKSILCRTSEFDDVEDGQRVEVRYAPADPVHDCGVGRGERSYDAVWFCGVAGAVALARLIVLLRRRRRAVLGMIIGSAQRNDEHDWIEGW